MPPKESSTLYLIKKRASSSLIIVIIKIKLCIYEFVGCNPIEIYKKSYIKIYFGLFFTKNVEILTILHIFMKKWG